MREKHAYRVLLIMWCYANFFTKLVALGYNYGPSVSSPDNNCAGPRSGGLRFAHRYVKRLESSVGGRERGVWRE